ncbi:MAG TPA: hypothetical protein VMW69_05810 [Spirochaetia bacterium]|nr:hypothetical protein [Spirochaetia bacterium]
MDDKQKLRRGDFVMSSILILFGIFVIVEAFQMPMQAKYGGVESFWYVSPALMPLIVGSAIILFSVFVLVRAIKDGGARLFFEMISKRTRGISDAGIRFAAIVIALALFVFLDIPRVDFFLSILFFLLYFISVFYFDNMGLLKKLTIFFVAAHAVLLVIFATGLAGGLNQAFAYTTDVVALLFIVAFWVYARALVARDNLLRKKLRLTLIVSIVVPLILCPIFMYGLLVPMPYQGGILSLMDLVRYSLGGH